MDPGRPAHRRPDPQGHHAGEPQRVPLRDRARDRQAHCRQSVREGELGGGHRQGDRPADLERGYQGRDRERREAAHLSGRVRRQELGPDVVRPEVEYALHQHQRLGHELRARAGRAGREPQGRPAALRREIPAGVRSELPRAFARGRSAHRQIQVGAAVQEPEHRRHHGDRRRARVHGHADGRVHRRRRRQRQDRLALPDAVRHRRPAHRLGERRQGVHHGDQRHRRRLCAQDRRSKHRARAGRRHAVDLQAVRGLITDV